MFPWEILVGKSVFIVFTKSTRHCLLSKSNIKEWMKRVVSVVMCWLFYCECKFAGMAINEIEKEAYMVLMSFGDFVVTRVVMRETEIVLLLFLL